jgi:4,5-dihydroxyphthalate decarboxylase
MSRLSITVASWDYDRGAPSLTGVCASKMRRQLSYHAGGRVLRAGFFHAEFEVAGSALAYPIALSRARRRTSPSRFLSPFSSLAIYVRSDRGIERPQDLRGKRIGVPEYQMSAAMWVRGFLQDDFGIAAAEIEWVQAGLENAGRRDKFPLNLPKGFPLTTGGPGGTLSGMLAEGRLDAVISARPPSCFIAGLPNVRRLFPDYRTAERDYFVRTGLFPIMHAVGIPRRGAAASVAPRERLQGVRTGQAHG